MVIEIRLVGLENYPELRRLLYWQAQILVASQANGPLSHSLDFFSRAWPGPVHSISCRTYGTTPFTRRIVKWTGQASSRSMSQKCRHDELTDKNTSTMAQIIGAMAWRIQHAVRWSNDYRIILMDWLIASQPLTWPTGHDDGSRSMKNIARGRQDPIYKRQNNQKVRWQYPSCVIYPLCVNKITIKYLVF